MGRNEQNVLGSTLDSFEDEIKSMSKLFDNRALSPKSISALTNIPIRSLSESLKPKTSDKCIETLKCLIDKQFELKKVLIWDIVKNEWIKLCTKSMNPTMRIFEENNKTMIIVNDSSSIKLSHSVPD